MLLAAACSSGSIPESSAAAENPAPAPQTEWVAATPAGLEVTLRPTSIPISVGTVEFIIEFGAETPDPSRLSFDLISPDMPMMDVRRFPVEAHEGGFLAIADIPMAGLWNAYVNIGVGTEAAEFAFEVQATPGEDAHQHGMAAPERLHN